MGKKLTKKMLVILTLMCMIIGLNVSVSAETGSTGNTKAISAAENPADGTQPFAFLKSFMKLTSFSTPSIGTAL